MIASCEIDHTVPPSTAFRGGRREPERHLHRFPRVRLRRYSAEENEPSAHATSGPSPYLHFGYISSLEVALAVREYAAAQKLVADEFLEELIVRRELAFNFVRYAKRVDSLDELPEWARSTLNKHRADPATRYIPENSSRAPRRAMIYGTPPKRNYCCAGIFLAITGCIGARRLWSGRPPWKRRCPR
ncbi:MAG TPA: hypothetical protein VGZ73_30250 [Bryobacteraceae bacterium]|nr:hypothetical protein [Bryobacteraceae bacterium]